MRHAAILALLSIVPLGCHPLRVISFSRVALDNPLKTDATITMKNSAPNRVEERIVAMPLEGRSGEACGPRIALIDVDGLLFNQNMVGLSSVGDNPVSLFREKLEAVASDPDVCAVVLRINSPGGAVNACDVMFHELQSFRRRTGLPVVACSLDMAAGGAYLLAAGCDRIVAHPTSVVGGVGVVWNGYNLIRTMGLQSIDTQTIKAGDYIDLGTSLRLYTDEEKKLLQGMANDYHQHFKELLQRLRPRLAERCSLYGTADVDPLDGRVFAAPQAVRCGLIDHLGYLDDAVAEARRLADRPQATVVLFHRADDPAYSPYSVTPNSPLQNTLLPLSLPGVDRSKLPTFLFMWQPEPTAERLTGR